MKQTGDPAHRSTGSSLLTSGLILLLLVMSAEFLVRGPLRKGDMGDFISPFVAAVRYNHYANPYTLKNFAQDWHAAGAPSATPLKQGMDAVAYPPSSLAVIGPYARLPWVQATNLYIWLCTALYLLLVYLLAHEVDSSWRSPRRLLFASFALGMAPVQTGIHEANLSVFAFLLCGYALLLAKRGSDMPAAVLLTLSLFLKPTVGFTLILLFVCTRRWRIVSVGALLGAALAAITVLHMRHIDPAWRADYQHALTLIVSNDGPGSFVSKSAAKFDLLNLQVPFYQITHSSVAANLAAWGVTAALAFAWVVIMLRRPRHAWSWADAGAIGLVSLLPIYQRNYNAGILIFCLLWAFLHWERRIARAILLLSCVFLVPGVALLRSVINPRLPHGVDTSYLWNVLVMPHASLVLIPLTCLTLVAMRTPERARTRLPVDTPGLQETRLAS